MNLFSFSFLSQVRLFAWGLVLASAATVAQASFVVEFLMPPEEASLFAADLSVDSTSGVQVIETNINRSRITVGPFNYTADALMVHDHVGLFGVDALLIREVSNEVAQDSLDFVPSSFGTNDDRSSFHATKNLKGDSLYAALESLDTPSTEHEYISALIDAKMLTEKENPLRGYIDLNLGMKALLRGDYDAADRYLSPVAKNEVASTPNHRIMAMWRIAWLAHQEGELLKAYRLYSETERYADDNPRTRARMIKERAGLIMELAKDANKGSLAEFQDFVRSNRPLVESQFIDDLATIDLMYIESYYYQGEFDYFLSIVDDFLESQSPESKKQIAMALVFKGVAFHNIGDNINAFRTLESILEMEFGPSDRFQTIPDFKLHSLKWMEEIARRGGDEALQQHYKELYVQRQNEKREK